MSRWFRSLLALLAIWSAFQPGARAQDAVVETIIVRGEREPLKRESLSIEEVRESPARDVGEALKDMKGISIVRKGPIANDVVLRGMKRDDLNVLIDGVRLYGGCPNRMDPPAFHVDFAEVDEVRVVKGPYDVENAGSLGGFVDIRTEEPPMGLGAKLVGSYGSYDSRAASGRASYRTDKFNGLVGYAYKDSLRPKDGDGNSITDVYPPTSPHRYREGVEDSRAYLINTIWTKWGVEPTVDSGMDLNYAYQDAADVIYPYLLMDAVYDLTHRLRWSYAAEDVSDTVNGLEAHAYWDMVDHLMDNRRREASRGTPDDFTMRADADSRVYGIKLNGTLAAGRPNTLRVGTDYYSRRWDVMNTMFNKMSGMLRDQPMIPGVVVDNVGFFVRFERRLGREFSLNLGLRTDLTWAKAEGLNARRLDSLYRPYFPGAEAKRDFQEVGGSVALTYTPIESLEFVAGFGRGVRPPDPQELYIGLERQSSNWIGNPTLEATKNYQADVGAKLVTKDFYVTASGFYRDVRDYINVTDLPDPDGDLAGSLIGARSYENVDAEFLGGELGAQVSLPRDLFLNASLSYVRAENTTAGRPLSEIPPLNGTVGLRYDVDSFFAEVAENLAGRQDRVDSSLNETETAGWATTDLTLGVRYRGLSVYGGVMNIFDKMYFTHLSYLRDPFASGVRVPENGRNFFLTATYAFQGLS